MTRENILPREDILRMSREAGLNMGTIQQYERFTQLIANALAALQSAALRKELAKPEQEPVAYGVYIDQKWFVIDAKGRTLEAPWMRLYTSPPQPAHDIKEQA